MTLSADKRPVIGIPACMTDNNGKPAHRVAGKYIDCLLETTNGIPLLIPAFGDIAFAEHIVERLDGLFLTGSGSNVEPHRYDGPPSRAGTAHDPARDGTTLPVIRAAVETGVPVFAVCRGIQELNVALGGTLHQNVHELPGKNEHRMNRAAETDERFSARHPIEIEPGGLLHEIIEGKTRAMVNSLHAQAIDRVGDDLLVDAVSDDGVVEAVSGANRESFTLGVQWHPEYPLTEENELSLRLFRAFDEAMARYHAGEKAFSRGSRAA